MKFSLATIAYVFALLAAAMATFGGPGIVASVVVLVYWKVMAGGSKRRTIASLVIAPLILVLVATSLGRAVDGAYSAMQRQLCMSNLKQVTNALHRYESTNGAFPPATTYDKDNTALHSWRTLVLPDVNQAALAQSIDMTKPWNDRANLPKLSNARVPTFECPAHDHGAAVTSYFAVTGDRTAWPAGRGRKWKELIDGSSNTILLLEVPHKVAMWGKPADVTMEEAVEFLSNPPKNGETGHHVDRGFFFKPSVGVLAAFADGHLKFLALPLRRDVAVALLTVDGGEEIGEADLRTSAATAELDYRRCYAFAAFVGLALLPGVSLVRRVGRRKESPAN